MAMFSCGFVAGDRELLELPERHGISLHRITGLGFAIGLPGSLADATAIHFAPGTPTETAALALSILTAPFLTMALTGVLLRIFGTAHAGGWRAALASAGRMALTNYLGQSVICALIFHGYGFGQIDRLSLATTLAAALVIFVGQVIVSQWWLRNFAYGPVE